jgi:hypothetical protein
MSSPAYADGSRALPHQSHRILSSSLISAPFVCAACRPQQTRRQRNHRTQPIRVASRPPPPNRQTTKRHWCRIAVRALGRIGFGRFLGIGRIASLVLLRLNSWRQRVEHSPCNRRHSWNLSIPDAAQSVHPSGHPMSHSTHVGFRLPPIADCRFSPPCFAGPAPIPFPQFA